MNVENSKTNETLRFRLSLADQLNLKDPSKSMGLANLSIYYTMKNIKSAYNNNKFKISAPTWNDELDSPDGSYSIADIQAYFEFIIKILLYKFTRIKSKKNCFQNKKRIQTEIIIFRNDETIREYKKRC